jgi:hypothetical protein
MGDMSNSEELIREARSHGPFERGIDFEGDAKACARHIQTEGKAALAARSGEQRDGC